MFKNFLELLEKNGCRLSRLGIFLGLNWEIALKISSQVGWAARLLGKMEEVSAQEKLKGLGLPELQNV